MLKGFKINKLKALSKVAGLIVAGTAAGAITGRTAARWTASAQGRNAAGKEGKTVGGGMGAVLTGAALASGFIFRKIRGRIVRIKVKR